MINDIEFVHSVHCLNMLSQSSNFSCSNNSFVTSGIDKVCLPETPRKYALETPVWSTCLRISEPIDLSLKMDPKTEEASEEEVLSASKTAKVELISLDSDDQEDIGSRSTKDVNTSQGPSQSNFVVLD